MIKNILKNLVLVSLLVSMSGCASYLVMNNSKKRIAYRRDIARGETQTSAMQARVMGDGGVGFGIDISNLEALTERPVLQIFSMLTDFAILYGSYKGIDSLSTDEKDSILISGNDNTVNIGTGNKNDTSSNSTTEK